MISDNFKSTVDIFKNHKGEFVIIDKKVTRFIAIASDDHDFLYITWNGRDIKFHTILDRLTILKDKIDDEHYNDWIRTAKLNHYDCVGRFVYEDGKEIDKGHNENNIKVITLVEEELANYKNLEMMSEIYWELN